MAYQQAATAVTLNDLEDHSLVAGFFKCNPLNICAAFYTISTDTVLAWFLCISRASCYQLTEMMMIGFGAQTTIRLCNPLYLFTLYLSIFFNPLYLSV